jgi:DnaK suppressor protein
MLFEMEKSLSRRTVLHPQIRTSSARSIRNSAGLRSGISQGRPTIIPTYAAARKTHDKEEYKMAPADTERLTNILRTKEAELSGWLRNRDEIVIENAPDPLDQVQLMGERELALRNLDRDSNMLRQIRRALSRIANGIYGLCLHCEEDILPKRMAAVPWAAYCVKCQEKIDRSEIEIDETVELMTSAG